MTTLRFDDRVAVITGSGRGLGRAYAELLASRGCKVVVNDLGVSMKGEGIDVGPAEETVQAIKAAGGEAVANTDTVATADGGRKIIQSALDHYGRIDILIHNAGNVRRNSLKEMSTEDFDAVLNVHLRGAFFVVRAAFPHMAQANYGRVVLTSSIAGLYGGQNITNYATSKTGMIGMSNVIALEGAAVNVKSNCIVPGAVTRMSEGIDTSQFPPMSPDMVAPIVGWLSHESCSVSGELYASIAGRIARVYVSETQGVYRPSWSMEDVAQNIDAIRDASAPWALHPLPLGQFGHIQKSFEMVRRGGK